MKTDELEQMRRQYDELKAMLDRQEIINEKIIHETIRKDLRMINDKKWIALAAAVLLVPLMCYINYSLNLRPAFLAASIAFVLFMALTVFFSGRDLSKDTVDGESSQAFLKEIKRRKAAQFRRLRINFVLAIFWLAYFIGECLHSGAGREILVPLFTGMVVGAAAGLIIGVRMHNRIISAYEGIILELENPEAADSIRK